jgi:plastocyanin
MQLAALMLAAIAATPVMTGTRHSTHGGGPDYLPDEAASQVVTVTVGEQSAGAAVTVLTQALATKESGPKQTVARFGEVYVFAPSFIAVHRDQPMAVTFWNLQADDVHDFMLTDPDRNVLMKVTLPALRKTSYVFSFHREGLFEFYCTLHQPEMGGQILVLPPAAR